MIQNKSYQEIEQYILGIPKFGTKNTLEDITDFWIMMGQPGIRKKMIHVAGTNGKGSVCAYLQSILSEAGFKTGMFTSPHLITMRERIRIQEKMVTEEEFQSAFWKVMNAVEQVNNQKAKQYHPSFFEFLFLMGMELFEEAQVDYIILETGLGGRLDATNVIKNPKVCVITQIGYDHTEFLGEEITQIASEKAGIMKPFVPVVFCDKNISVTAVLQKKAEELGCPVYFITPSDLSIEKIGNKTIDFSFHTRYYNYSRLSLSTRALYQIDNAALAVQAVETLGESRITQENIRSGLYKAVWPGRMEEIETDIYLDGAHNEDGMKAFLETVAADECKGKRYLLFGAVKEKNYEEMIRLIAKSRLFARVAAAPLLTDRSVEAEKLKEAFAQYTELSYLFCEDPLTAVTELKQHKKKDDFVYIAGSLYLAGQIKLGKENSND